MARGLSSYRPPFLGRQNMVSAGHYLAAGAAYRVLEDGGNAIDAGVASGIVLGVVCPPPPAPQVSKGALMPM